LISLIFAIKVIIPFGTLYGNAHTHTLRFSLMMTMMTKLCKAGEAKEEPIHIADAFHVGVMLSEMEGYGNGKGDQFYMGRNPVGYLIKAIYSVLMLA